MIFLEISVQEEEMDEEEDEERMQEEEEREIERMQQEEELERSEEEERVARELVTMARESEKNSQVVYSFLCKFKYSPPPPYSQHSRISHKKIILFLNSVLGT